jgi:hypothetical protein
VDQSASLLIPFILTAKDGTGIIVGLLFQTVIRVILIEVEKYTVQYRYILCIVGTSINDRRQTREVENSTRRFFLI